MGRGSGIQKGEAENQSPKLQDKLSPSQGLTSQLYGAWYVDREKPSYRPCCETAGKGECVCSESHQGDRLLKQNHPHSLEGCNRIQSPKQSTQNAYDTFLDYITYQEPERYSQLSREKTTGGAKPRATQMRRILKQQ